MIKETVLSRSMRLVFATLALPAFAQTAPDVQPIQRVEITGSSIRRVAAETALPVTVMRHEDIERTGATTAQDLVNLIPSNFGGTVLANNVGQTGAPSTANLRGLGPNYTLVLLNGRRVSNYALGNNPVDLNSIPLSAIERVEVLRDGASAVYGADAIAGVINFILKSDYQGMEVSGYYGRPSDPGGKSKSANILGGFGSLDKEGFNVMLSYNRENDDVLKATDRSFAKTGIRPDLGIAHTSPRGGIPNFNFADSKGNNYGDAINAANPVIGPSINPTRANNCAAPGFAMANDSASTCQTDYVQFIDLIPKATHDNLIARGVVKLDADNQLYAEASYTKDHVTASYSPAPYTNAFSYPVGGKFYPSSITIPKGTTLPAGYIMPNGSVLAADTVLGADMAVTPVSALSGRWRTVSGGGRQDITDVKNTRFLIGAKGTIAGWDYDTALTSSKNEGVISFGNGQFSYAKLGPVLASGALNVFGPLDDAGKALLAGTQLSGLENSGTAKATQGDFRISREVGSTGYGAIGLAVGASARKETLDQVSSPTLASGDVVGGNGPVPGVSSGRKVYGAFTEVTIPLYKDLELDGALRYDKYKNDFGSGFSKVSPKVSLRWQLEKTLVLRGSYGTGFRAPTLYDNLFPFTAGGATVNNWSDPIRCPGGVPVTGVKNVVGAAVDECNVQLTIAQVGNRDLRPEKSKQFSLGMAFQPMASFSGSLDYWNVRINDAIQYPAESQIFNQPVAFAPLYYRFDPATDPNQLKPFVSSDKNYPLSYVLETRSNFARNFAAGVDVNLNFKQKVDDLGRFGLNLDGTVVTKHGYQYPTGAEVSDLGKFQDFGVTPRWRHVLTGTWSRGAWNASLTHNYTAGYEDYTDPASVGGANYPAIRDVSSNSIWDATVGFTGVKGLELTLGVKNMFNKEPPSSRASTGSGFQVGYDSVLGNPLGRVVYLHAKYKVL
ncbi:MAG: TonB-dependent receptor [Pseudomonadota bacterium]